MRTKGSRKKSRGKARTGFGLGAEKMEWHISQQGAVQMVLGEKKVSFGLLIASTTGHSNRVRWFIADVKRLPASTPITSVAELDVIWFRKPSGEAIGFKGTLRDFLRQVVNGMADQKLPMRRGKKS